MNDLLNSLMTANPRLMTAVLLVLSFGLHVLAVNLRERLPATDLNRYPPFLRAVAWLGYELVRLVFYVAPLYAALYFGWIDLRSVGLGPVGAEGLNWGEGIRWFLVLGVGTWGFLMLIWMPYLRATGKLTEHFTPGELTRAPRRAFEVILMQAHWAFYRGAFALLLDSVTSLYVYWGAVVGLGLVLLEVWSDPRVRRQFMNVGQVEWGAWSAGLAVISAIAYLLTLNLWLVAVLHLLLEFSVPHLHVQPQGEESPGGNELQSPQVPS
ncbi:MAG TPA: hypothetical protein VIX58_10465 [Anaerolineae bacterium]